MAFVTAGVATWGRVLLFGPCGRDMGTWSLEGDGARPDLRAVDELARLALAARRVGGAARLEDATPDLRALLALCGLVEVLGEAEGGEERGVDEVVEPDDPPV